ncbi:MAG: hypothetical protein A3K09_04060 [Nitrospinae bacterium RIFCSPLOWO2_12_FULL_47_7]|nr:MAG: hypothetical protein A3K09_04060 [Nitrospinae bacterium RIFCSPLOWO2_12_FULL_47_7]
MPTSPNNFKNSTALPFHGFIIKKLSKHQKNTRKKSEPNFESPCYQQNPSLMLRVTTVVMLSEAKHLAQ